ATPCVRARCLGIHWHAATRAGGAPIGNLAPPRRHLSRRRPVFLDWTLVVVVVVLATGLAASRLAHEFEVQAVAPSLDLVLDTLTTVVTLSVAVLAWVRFRERGEPVAPFQAAAFLVLAIANGLNVGLVVTGLDRQAGMTLGVPGQAPLYDFTLARLFAAALLVLGGVGALRAWRLDHAGGIVLGSAFAVVTMFVLVQVGADRLPSLGAVSTYWLPTGEADLTAALPTPMPLGAAVQVLGAALFLWAAGLARRLYRRDQSIADAYVAVGLVFAAFAQVDAAFYPSIYTGLVTGGDVLRLAFDVTLLLGIQAEAGATLSRLRRANERLARLRVVELERAGLEERTRLARELHDGLAQDLWLAKLKSRRLAGLPDLGAEGRCLAGEVGDAIDAGLAEAQQAVAALRLSGEPAGTLCEVMSRSMDEFADRFGLRAELECGSDVPALPARAQAEALRITQEALNNVRRHADATVVRVKVAVNGGRLVLVVGDNGRGFDPEAVGPSAFGLASMRERAALIGGELSIESQPHDGTRVSLLLPLPQAPVPVPVPVPATVGPS
ncbi:MAG TPA: sensor histidine kinase, partial [Candidatus Limnocylindrales bacterium]